MIVPAAATILFIAVGAIVFWGAVIPLGVGTIEWVFNIGGTRRR
jgi:hypothetical protein